MQVHGAFATMGFSRRGGSTGLSEDRRLDQRRRDPQAGTKGLYLADWFLTSSFLPGRSNWVTSQEQNHTLS